MLKLNKFPYHWAFRKPVVIMLMNIWTGKREILSPKLAKMHVQKTSFTGLTKEEYFILFIFFSYEKESRGWQFRAGSMASLSHHNLSPFSLFCSAVLLGDFPPKVLRKNPTSTGIVLQFLSMVSHPIDFCLNFMARIAYYSQEVWSQWM